MKKYQSTSIPLKFKKTSVANLYRLQGGAQDNVSEESSCCTEHPVCPKTVATRPDSLSGS